MKTVIVSVPRKLRTDSANEGSDTPDYTAAVELLEDSPRG